MTVVFKFCTTQDLPYLPDLSRRRTKNTRVYSQASVMKSHISKLVVIFTPIVAEPFSTMSNY